MKIEYILCDHCGASMPEGSGAIVNKYTDEHGSYATMFLCDRCFHSIFDKPTDEAKLKESEGAE